jgi:endoglucanase
MAGLHSQPVEAAPCLSGVNWFGFETSNYVVHGLWTRDYKDMLDQIAGLGYNVIRLPFSNQLLDSGTMPNGIDFSSGKNADLEGLASLEVMDKIISYGGSIELQFILDNHRSTAGNSAQENGLWYTDAYPESRWISDWEMLANRYQSYSNVIAADLRNEPHDSACWGCGDPALDWRRAAEKAGNAILAINPDWYILVEGVECYGPGGLIDPYTEGVECTWWGGNLLGAQDYPIRLSDDSRLVYSPHDYPASVYPQSWFNDPNYPGNLPGIWDHYWGYLKDSSPILIGEFGTRCETTSDQQWMQELIAYIGANDLDWTYWSWNPNSGDTGGILNDDWTTVDQTKQSLLSTIQCGGGPWPTASPTSTSPPGPTLTPSEAACAVDYDVQNDWGSGATVSVDIINEGSFPINGWTLEWTFPDDQQITNLWGGSYTQSGVDVSVTNASWNGTIPANGGLVSVGFNMTYSGSNQAPAQFTLNGTVCR